MKAVIGALTIALFSLTLSSPAIGGVDSEQAQSASGEKGNVVNRVSYRPSRTEMMLKELAANGASGAKIRMKTGFIEVGRAEGSRAARSTSKAISVRTPRYFRWPNRPNLLYATGGWKLEEWYPDINKNGGADAFGIRFSKPIVNYGSYLDICHGGILGPDEDNCWKATNYFENSENGASWQFQDKTRWHIQARGWKKANWAKGTFLIRIKPLRTGCYQAFARYAHSFRDTKITGMGLSMWGFSVSTSRDDDHWGRTSGAGRFRC